MRAPHHPPPPTPPPQLAVAILKLSPNVAGVTFLAVGNAACDVIASIAAISTGATEVGVGTTVGAGIFVTTAVVAAVSFVADVRLARRSFLRDVGFFLFTVIYLIGTTWDQYISLAEAIGATGGLPAARGCVGAALRGTLAR